MNCDPETARLPYLLIAQHPLGSRVIEASRPWFEPDDPFEVLKARLDEAGDALVI